MAASFRCNECRSTKYDQIRLFHYHGRYLGRKNSEKL